MPHIIISVRSAPNALGKYHLLIWILQNRSTRGRPIMEKTPDTSM